MARFFRTLGILASDWWARNAEAIGAVACLMLAVYGVVLVLGLLTVPTGWGSLHGRGFLAFYAIALTWVFYVVLGQAKREITEGWRRAWTRAAAPEMGSSSEPSSTEETE